MKTGLLSTLALAGLLIAGAPSESRANGPGIAFTGHSYNSGGRGIVGGGSYAVPGYSYGNYSYGGYSPYSSISPSAGYNYTVPGYSDLDSSNYDGTTWLSQEVQRALARDGYYDGPADGVVGTQTHVAISLYQHENGLPITGTINDRLLRALGLREP